ncbi:MAG TPA: hypothetical protein ENH26_00335 [Candidatus Wolfebacteria bacterium]|nr:hypothetical protein [Candidatus Wolfebacteria bacterium]
MGLSIHYGGRFNKNAVLSDLITEVKEIAETFKWDYKIYMEEFPVKKNESQPYDGKIYGISFTPPECETISISFLSNYRMSSSAHLKIFGYSENQLENKFLYMLSVKTQFAGTTIHKAIIELFRYLFKRNYFSEFNLVDEGEYWETGNESLLVQKFKENGDLIDNFSMAIETIPIKRGESFEDYFERIIGRIDKRNKK